jgi:hypothetical protein
MASTVDVDVTGRDGKRRNARVVIDRISHGIDCWVATAKIVIDDEELVFTTAGQFTARVAMRTVAQWLYEKCEGRIAS